MASPYSPSVFYKKRPFFCFLCFLFSLSGCWNLHGPVVRFQLSKGLKTFFLVCFCFGVHVLEWPGDGGTAGRCWF